MKGRAITLPGINIQAPWAQAIVSGQKVIETRFYPMPIRWVGQPLVIIETPGKARNFKSRIVRFVISGAMQTRWPLELLPHLAFKIRVHARER